MVNSTSTNATTTNLAVSGNFQTTGTGTSTFAGSIAVTEVNATSTFAGGVDLSDGCFAIDGVCIGGGGGSSNWSDAGAYLTPLTTTDGILINSASSTITNLTMINSTTTNATTTNLSISGGRLNFSAIATTTIPSNSPFAWTIATTTTGGTLFRVDTTTGAESLTIGNTTGYASDVIIGVSATTTNLQFAASSTIYAAGTSATATSTLTFGSGNNIINFAVNTGFGTTSPWKTLSVNGGVSFVGLTSTSTVGNSLCLSNINEVTLATGRNCATAPSSLRFKENITPLTETSGLTEIMALNPISFRYKDTVLGSFTSDPNWNGVRTGFIAEEVQLVDPRLVLVDQNGQPDGVRYELITPILTKAVQELNSRLDSIASTTATTTPDSRLFTQSFFNNIFTRITSWFADTANGIGDFFANRVRTKELCVGDAGGAETCINKAQLDVLLTSNQVITATPPTPTPTSTPIIVPLPTDDGTPTPVGVGATTTPPVATSTPPIVATTTPPTDPVIPTDEVVPDASIGTGVIPTPPDVGVDPIATTTPVIIPLPTDDGTPIPAGVGADPNLIPPTPPDPVIVDPTIVP